MTAQRPAAPTTEAGRSLLSWREYHDGFCTLNDGRNRAKGRTIADCTCHLDRDVRRVEDEAGRRERDRLRAKAERVGGGARLWLLNSFLADPDPFDDEPTVAAGERVEEES